MNIGNWIALGALGVTLLTSIIVFYVNVMVRIKELEMKIKSSKEAFHIHEMQNEKTFDKLEIKIDGLFCAIDEVKNILIKKL